MKSGLNLKVTMLFLLALTLCVPAAQAQQKDPRLNAPVQPVSPVGAEESSSRDTGAAAAPAAPAAPVGSPLGGARQWTPEGSGTGVNFFLPSFNAYFGGDSNSRSGNSLTTGFTNLGGRLAFQRVWKTSEFTTEYSGGGSFYYSDSRRNRSHQDLRMSYEKAFRRWSFLLADTVNYSPEGGFGRSQGFGFLGPNQGSVYGGGLVNLNSLLVPNNSVLTTNSGRVTNTVVGQASFNLNARSALTVSGTYGTLNFLDAGLIDSQNFNVRAGYTYALTARDTVGITYQHGLFQFSGTSQENTSHMAHLTYGRQLTGRLTLDISGGPQYTVVSPALGGKRKLLRWSLASSLKYRLSRGSVGFEYSHFATGGSGFFLGAESDRLQATFGRQLSRQWLGTLRVSLARNESLFDNTGTLGGRRFYTWGAGTTLSRPIGRHTSMYFDYNFQRQTSRNISCVGPHCALDGNRHVFGVGFSFRFSPIELE